MKARKPGLPPRVGIISPCGWGNLGDAAIVAATLEGIRARVPMADMFAITLNPEDTKQRHGIPAFTLSADRYRGAGGWAAAWESRDVGSEEPSPSFKQRLRRANWLRPALRLASPVLGFLANLRQEFRHAVASFRLVKAADLLIVAGGGQLDDYWGGAWAHPFNLLKWGCIARLAGPRSSS